MLIFLIILILIVLLCLSGPVVAVRFRDGTFTWKVSYCGIRILPRKKKNSGSKKNKKEKPGKGKGTDKSKKKKQEEQEAENRKPFLMDKLWKRMQDNAGKADLIENVLHALPGPLHRLLRGMTWYAIETDFVIGGEDAADCAVLYGRVNSLLHPLLGSTGNYIKVKQKRISVVCDFTADTCRWDFACRFRVRVGAVLSCGIGLAWLFLTGSRRAKRQLSGTKL